ncbi:hypothetical protein STEG23_025686 [Scotinomys teguina]
MSILKENSPCTTTLYVSLCFYDQEKNCNTIQKEKKVELEMWEGTGKVEGDEKVLDEITSEDCTMLLFKDISDLFRCISNKVGTVKANLSLSFSCKDLWAFLTTVTSTPVHIDAILSHGYQNPGLLSAIDTQPII